MTRAFVLALALAAMGGSAQAHANLEHAIPRVGGVVAASPAELSLQFDDDVQPALCSVTLSRGGVVEPLGPLVPAPGDNSVLIAKVKARLTPGVYRVEWQVTAEDGHRTNGSYSFEVRP